MSRSDPGSDGGGTPVFKVMLLLKRRPGMSLEEFIERYEREHAPLVVRNGSTNVFYARHYLHPQGEFIWDVSEDGRPEPEYDVITELWYPDRAAFDAQMASVRASPDRLAAIVADEEQIFDRSRSRVTFVETRTSGDGAPGAAEVARS